MFCVIPMFKYENPHPWYEPLLHCKSCKILAKFPFSKDSMLLIICFDPNVEGCRMFNRTLHHRLNNTEDPFNYRRYKHTKHKSYSSQTRTSVNSITIRMHSSRMRTNHLLTICRSLLPTRGVSAWGVSAPRGCLLQGCLLWGVSAPGCLLQGVCSRGVSALGGVCSRGVCSRGVSALGGLYPSMY